jgi:hypothetical protein
VGFFSGASWNGKGRLYYIDSGDGNAYYPGDAVLSYAGADAFGTPRIVKATVGTETLRGAIIAIYAFNPVRGTQVAGSLPQTLYAPATKTQNYYAMVADDPATIFEITDDGLTVGSLVAANANKNFTLTIAAPTSPQQMSATVMLSSSLATTSTFNMKAMGLAPIQGNVFGAQARWLCMINCHELGHGPGTAGV